MRIQVPYIMLTAAISRISCRTVAFLVQPVVQQPKVVKKTLPFLSMSTFDALDVKRKVNEAVELMDSNLVTALSKDRLKIQIADLEQEQADPSFWDDANSSKNKRVTSQLSECNRLLNRLIKWEELRGECLAGLELLTDCGDDDELKQAILLECDSAASTLLEDGERFELEKLLSGKYDDRPARIIITAGAGGTEACDWVDILHRMYVRHAEKMEYKVLVEDKTPGDEVGYKKVILFIDGPPNNVFGWFRGEKGAHRLVRLSPFNANNKRQTTFAGVDVVPVLDDEEVESLDIPESELEITTMRSGGAGKIYMIVVCFHHYNAYFFLELRKVDKT